MVSLMLPSLLMFISLSMALPSNDGHLQEPTLKRLARNVGQQRHFHQLIDKVLEHEKNNLHQTDGAFALKIFEDSACLEACYKCVEDYPTTAVSSLVFVDIRSIDFSIDLAQEEGNG